MCWRKKPDLESSHRLYYKLLDSSIVVDAGLHQVIVEHSMRRCRYSNRPKLPVIKLIGP